MMTKRFTGPYEARVKLTIAMPFAEYGGTLDALETVILALRGQAQMPEGAHLHGSTEVRILDAWDLEREAKRRAAKTPSVATPLQENQ